MIEFIRTWLLGMTGAAIFCAIAAELTPKGPVKGVVKTVCGIVMTAAFLTPLFSFDFPTYALELAKYRANAETLTKNAEEISGELNRTIIEADLEAYILDKAQTLGAAVTDAKVSVRWSTEGIWYPTKAELTGPFDAALSAYIEAEIGIPREAQTWRTNEEP